MSRSWFVLAATALLAGAVPAVGANARWFRSDDIAFRYPAGWHVTTRRLDYVLDPHTVAAVSSYAIPAGPRDNCDGTHARGRPLDGAFVLIKEVRDGASRRLGLRRLRAKPRNYALPRAGRAGCLPPV